MAWHNNYANEWEEIILAVARAINREPFMIEKDVVQSMFLYQLAQEDASYVFKGGTSLSKAYGIIDRFSEDIDISMDHKPTVGQRKKSKTDILSVADKLGFELKNAEDIQSRRDFNRYYFSYQSILDDTAMEFIVETSYMHPVFPSSKMLVNSFVGNYCKDNQINLPVPFDAINTTMLIQSLERGLIDKVFAICDYMLKNRQERNSRHLYDIAKILPHITVDKSLYRLINEVRNERMTSQNNPSAQPEYDISNLLEEIIKNHYFENDYNTVTKKILYEDISYDKAIKEGIEKIAAMNMFAYQRP